jgi:hypothetical protein
MFYVTIKDIQVFQQKYNIILNKKLLSCVTDARANETHLMPFG